MQEKVTLRNVERCAFKDLNLKFPQYQKKLLFILYYHAKKGKWIKDHKPKKLICKIKKMRI